MAYTTPGAWTTGETVAVGKLNALIDDIPALYNRLTHEDDHDADAVNTYTPTNGAGSWENDSSGLVSQVTPEQVSTLLVIATATWYDEAQNDQTMAFRIANSTDATYGGSTGLIGCDNASCRQRALVLGRFASVTAAAKTVRLQGSRADSGKTIRVISRTIAAFSVSEATA